jgi:hypothetical protein
MAPTMGTMTRAAQESQREKRSEPSLSKTPLNSFVRTVRRGKLNSTLFCSASFPSVLLPLNDFHQALTP